MTGEITLRGKVLPVGGIKEKVRRRTGVGIRAVILPRLNERDVEDVPEELRKQVRFIFVDDAEEVLRHALNALRGRRALGAAIGSVTATAEA